MEHQGGGDPWRAIAQALGVESHDLLFWEKVAKVVHAPRLPGFQSQDKPQPLLVGFFTSLTPRVDAVQRQEHCKPRPDLNALLFVADTACLV